MAIFSLFHEARALVAQDDRCGGAFPIINKADIHVADS